MDRFDLPILLTDAYLACEAASLAAAPARKRGRKRPAPVLVMTAREGILAAAKTLLASRLVTDPAATDAALELVATYGDLDVPEQAMPAIRAAVWSLPWPLTEAA